METTQGAFLVYWRSPQPQLFAFRMPARAPSAGRAVPVPGAAPEAPRARREGVLLRRPPRRRARPVGRVMAARRGPGRGKAADEMAPALPSPAVEERAADVYARVTEAIVAAIEGGMAKGRDWRMPWHRRRDAGALPALPVNVARGTAYRGVNALALWAAAEAHGYPAGLWGTFRQWVRRESRMKGVVSMT